MSLLTERPVGRPRSCNCGECFKCKRADYMRGWWNRKTPDEKRAHIAKRDPDRVRESYRKRQQKRRQDPDFQVKEKARRATRKLERQPCEVCGAQKAHAHHDDYEKPLDVRWLCRIHHHELHGLGAD